MAQIRIGETDFYYECQGKGRPLVLIAGYSCDHTFWDAIYDKLTPHFQVLTFDNRAIGQTIDHNTQLSIELMANDTIQLMKALEIKNPIILGQSMGGTIAQTIARQQANEIEINKLIILNSSSKINERTLMVLATFIKMLNEKVDIDTVLEASMPWFFSSDYLTAQNIAAYKEICKNNPFPPTPAILARQWQALRQFDSRAWVSTLTTQTLVIASDDDIVCLSPESEDLAHCIAAARFV
jgi:pimeloyl-ACP methyl ester carboxylesterase